MTPTRWTLVYSCLLFATISSWRQPHCVRLYMKDNIYRIVKTKFSFRNSSYFAMTTLETVICNLVEMRSRSFHVRGKTRYCEQKCVGMGATKACVAMWVARMPLTVASVFLTHVEGAAEGCLKCSSGAKNRIFALAGFCNHRRLITTKILFTISTKKVSLQKFDLLTTRTMTGERWD